MMTPPTHDAAAPEADTTPVPEPANKLVMKNEMMKPDELPHC